MDLWKRHCGLKSTSDLKALCDAGTFWKAWIALAESNTKLYIEVFGRIEDNIENTSDLHYLTEFGLGKVIPKNTDKLQKIQGHLGLLNSKNVFFFSIVTIINLHLNLVNKSYC